MNIYYFPAIAVGAYCAFHYGKIYLNDYILNRVNEELNKKQDQEGVSFKTFERTKSAVVLYKYGGKEHKVCIPYDRTKSTSMLRKEVKLISVDGEIDITHKPGVPYLLSANEMGGSKITVVKDGKIIKEYIDDEIPGYLE